ncbi:hypothetical protein DH2020_042308 [Rehmannia glutinosa]|uniref:Transcription repressor n=1 Tax=Rehmannia glutinosa TaxID=99300 RepID=A0ABR0UNX7_REHGL
MKCGGKRFSPSASRASIISRVFQVSCFSQFKPKGDNPETNSAKKQHRGKLDFPTQYSSSVTEVKSSFNPQQDFRDSMVEMISEKGITRSDELEELLACYLTLNCDGYHELIIKVFRQVCFELSTRDAY